MSAVMTTAALAYLLTSSAVLARLYIMAYIICKTQIEDYLSYFAWSGLITYTSLLLYTAQHYGLARHMWDVPLVNLPHMLYFVNILYIIYGPTTAAAKMSVLFQIKRIFTSTGHGLVY